MSKDKRPDRFPGALQMMVLRTLKRQPLHGYTLERTSRDLLQIEEHLEREVSSFKRMLEGITRVWGPGES